MRSISGGVSGFAGIYAKELTREAIFEALQERRVYATTGCRSILRFHMGSIGMGQTAKLSEAGQPRQFTVSIFADGPIAEITLIKNNEIVATKPGDGLIMIWEWTDTEPARNGDYYYACIRQTDVQWVYSSPIWIELDRPAGAQARSPAEEMATPDKPKCSLGNIYIIKAIICLIVVLVLVLIFGSAAGKKKSEKTAEEDRET